MARRRPRWKKPAAGGGKKVDVYLTADVLPMYEQIENKSAFFQLALREAIGIMTWSLMKKQASERYYDVNQPNIEDVLPEFNAAFPLDPLTKARKAKKEQKCENSAPKQELW